MASLSGTQVRNTYSGILKTTDNAALTSTLKRVTDGAGGSSALQLSSTAIRADMLEIENAPTSGSNTVLVWDSSSKQVSSRAFPTFESVTAVTASITNGGTLTISDSAGNSNATSFVDDQAAIDVSHSSGTFTISGTGILPVSAGNTSSFSLAAVKGTIIGIDGTGAGAWVSSIALTLPLASVGANCKVIIQTTDVDSFKIATSGSDFFWGVVRVRQYGTGNVTHLQEVASSTSGLDEMTIYAAGTTTGGAAGSMMSFTCLTAGSWHVEADLITLGVLSGAVDTIA